MSDLREGVREIMALLPEYTEYHWDFDIDKVVKLVVKSNSTVELEIDRDELEKQCRNIAADAIADTFSRDTEAVFSADGVKLELFLDGDDIKSRTITWEKFLLLEPRESDESYYLKVAEKLEELAKRCRGL